MRILVIRHINSWFEQLKFLCDWLQHESNRVIQFYWPYTVCCAGPESGPVPKVLAGVHIVNSGACSAGSYALTDSTPLHVCLEHHLTSYNGQEDVIGSI